MKTLVVEDDPVFSDVLGAPLPAGQKKPTGQITAVALHDLVKGALRYRLEHLLDSTYAVHVAAVVVDRVGACGLTAFSSLPQHPHPRSPTRPLYKPAPYFRSLRISSRPHSCPSISPAS